MNSYFYLATLSIIVFLIISHIDIVVTDNVELGDYIFNLNRKIHSVLTSKRRCQFEIGNKISHLN